MKSGLKIRMRFNGEETEIDLGEDQCVIGRSETLRVRMPKCPTLSREHLKIEYREGKIWITDLGSSNGTVYLGKKLQPKTAIEYSDGSLVLGDSENGLQVWISYLSHPSVEQGKEHADKQEQTQKVIDKLLLLEQEVEQLEQRKIQSEERQKVMLTRVEELIFREAELIHSIEDLKAKVEEGKNEVRDIESLIKEWEESKARADDALKEHEAKMSGMVAANEERERELVKLTEELEILKITTENERLQVKQKVDLEIEQMNLSFQLKKTQAENEIEQLKSVKLVLERDLELLRAENGSHEIRGHELKHDLQRLSTESDEKKKALKVLNEQLTALTLEYKSAEESLLKMRIDFEETQLRMKELIRSTEEEVESKRQSALQRLNQDLQSKTDRFEQDHANLIHAMKETHKKIEEQFNREHLAKVSSLEEELRAQKERDLSELRSYKASEEQKVRELLVDQRIRLARQLSLKILTKLSKGESAPPLMPAAQMESALLASIEEHLSGEGFVAEPLELSKKRFVRKAALWSLGSVAAILVLVFGPGLFQKKIEDLKAQNRVENENFMKELRAQREKMLALHLEVKSEFQDNYVDNILYNPGYLSLKLDGGVQKEWTSVLSKFFFEALLLDDQKVVEYVPVEQSLVRALSDVNRVLNNENFEVNLKKMRRIEEEKQPELWVSAGGKSNWIKIREREAEFYRLKVNTIEADSNSARMPADASKR